MGAHAHYIKQQTANITTLRTPSAVTVQCELRDPKCNEVFVGKYRAGHSMLISPNVDTTELQVLLALEFPRAVMMLGYFSVFTIL